MQLDCQGSVDNGDSDSDEETFSKPVSYIASKQNGIKIVKNVPIFAQFIPLREVFHKFFELSGLLEKTLDYQNKILKYSNVMENIIQGNLWKKICPLRGHILIARFACKFERV